MRQNKIYKIIAFVVIGLIILSSIIYFGNKNKMPQDKIDVFAKCISDSGARFYGAFWCSHCQTQKKLFNNSKLLPYIECSTPDGRSQKAECAAANISSYPTWRFADGKEEVGELSFDELAAYTNCEAPK